MKTNSKIIGNKFEREVAKILSLKLSDGKRTDLFCRTPGSGNTFKEGDIMPNDIDFDYIIECKTTKTGSIIPLKSSIKEYLRQCAKRYSNKKWLLIVKIRNYDGDIYCIAPPQSIDGLNGTVVARFCYANTTFLVFNLIDLTFKKKYDTI